MHLSRRKFLASSAAALWAASRRRPLQADEPREVPWLAEVQTPPDKLPDDAPKLSPLLVDDRGRPITSRQAWEARRVEIRAAWEKFLGTLRVERRPPKLEVVEEDRRAGVVRQLVRYEGEPGLTVEGYLIKPQEVPRPVPGVVVLHSTTNVTIRQPAGLAEMPQKAFGLSLARQGLVTFSPRCFLWEGEGSYEQRVARFKERHPGSLGMAKMLFDAIRGVDVLVAQPEVDAGRLGAVGHSLGAKEVLYLAAFDERIKASVSSEGGIGTKFSNWDAPWYLGEGIRGADFTREHHELLALVAPRAFLLLGGDSADGDRSWPFIQAALPVYRLYGEPCRVGLFNHRQGHSVPPEAEKRISQWLLTYL